MSTKKMKDIVEETKDVVSETKNSVPETKKDVMYLGPTIVGVARHSTTFKGGVLPQKLEECVKQFPIMEKLFVSLDEMPSAIKELNKEQSSLRTIYNQTAKKFK